jgi:ubiquitin-like-conjugating enzyme ATG3
MPSLLSNLKSAREWATPTLKSSAFLSRGVLTPEEFVLAGDELVYKCPTWSWETCDDPSKLKKYLPPNKQFLMTRNVPCGSRVSSMENVVVDLEGGGGDGHNDNNNDDDGDDDWLVSRILTAEEQRKRDEDALEQEFDILDDEGETLPSSLTKNGSRNEDAAVTKLLGNLSLAGKGGMAEERDSSVKHHDKDNNDEYADMADFEDDNVMEDEAAAVASYSTNMNSGSVDCPSSSAKATNKYTCNNDTNTYNNNIVKVRSYDVSITYDKYYQTPRVWLSGYADDGTNRPLTGQEMMEDVISDYAHRTVTMEYHPHLTGMQHASIHPCQHGAVMKTIIKNLMKDCRDSNTSRGSSSGSSSADKKNAGPSVENYLFIFLKFVSSMIPTISYDFTVDVSASTRK